MSCASHHPLPAGDAACDFTLLRRTGDDRRYNLAVIADPQIWFRKEFPQFEASMEDLARTVRSLGIPVQGLCCGDITAVDHAFYGPYNEIVARTGIPFRYVMGNHDMTLYGRSHESSFTKFEATYGPCYYSFDIGRIHYVMLNDNFYIVRLLHHRLPRRTAAARWLERDLEHVEPGRTVVVCLTSHLVREARPRAVLPMRASARRWPTIRGLYRLLEPYNVHILSGHTHTTSNQQITPRLYEHVIPALSGAWWQGELCTDGTPAGYALFEIEGDSIRWHYRSTGRPADYQIRLYDGRQTPQFAGLRRGQHLGQRPLVARRVLHRRREVRRGGAFRGPRSRRPEALRQQGGAGPQMDPRQPRGALLPRAAARRRPPHRGGGHRPLRADEPCVDRRRIDILPKPTNTTKKRMKRELFAALWLLAAAAGSGCRESAAETAPVKPKLMWLDCSANWERFSCPDSIRYYVDKCREAGMTALVLDIKGTSS